MITDEQWQDEIPKKVFAIPGMRTDSESDFMCDPVEEGVTTYFKFMSDCGATDDHNGQVFADYLMANGCVIERHRARSMIVRDADIERLFL